MDIEQAISAYLEGQAILFTGSGFSAGSKNIIGNEPPTGWKLRELLASKCNFDDPELGLEYIAQEYIEQTSEQSLIDELKNLYQIKNPSQDHNTILKKALFLPLERAILEVFYPVPVGQSDSMP